MSSKLPLAFEANMKVQLSSDYPEFEKALQAPAPISIRYNPLKKSKDLFENQEPIVWCSEGFYLKERPSFTLDPAFHTGAYYVQEASSMFLKEAAQQTVDFSKPIKVLDLCAAPGGKTTLLASLLNEQSILVANEVIKSRVGVLKENLLKWGFTNYIVSNHDSEEFADLEGFFDLVLVDAPCSGEGLFRKDENASSHWSEDSVQMCSARQKRILQAAAYLVAPKGQLIYSTCTYNTHENSDNVKWLTQHHDFELVDLDISKYEGIHKMAMGYQFYPHKIKGEGFFIAVLNKNSGSQDFSSQKIKLNRIPTKQLEILKNWIKNVDSFNFYTKSDGVVVAIPNELNQTYGIILKALFKRSSGFEIGEFKGQDFIPSHALAMSNLVHDSVPKTDLDKDNALRYLKREPIAMNATVNGFQLVCYQNAGLGWIKVIGDRINNYLPKDWRIRMDLEN